MNNSKEALIQQLEDENLNTRLRAISKLSDIGTPDIIEIFRGILKNKNEETDVRRYIIESFLEFEPSEIITDLLTILENKEEKHILRIAAAYVIGKFEMLPVSGLPVVGGNRNISDEIVVSFKKIVEDDSEDYRLRVEVLKSLKEQGAIVSLTAPFFNQAIDIITPLKNVAFDENKDNTVRYYASDAYLSIIPQKEE